MDENELKKKAKHGALVIMLQEAGEKGLKPELKEEDKKDCEELEVCPHCGKRLDEEPEEDEDEIGPRELEDILSEDEEE